MGVVWAVKESPELVLKWEKLIKTVLSRRMGPRRMRKVHQNPFTQELGGKARLVVTAHSYAMGTHPFLPLANPRDPLWEGPKKHRCKTGGQTKQEHPAIQRQIKSSGSCSLWHKMVSAHHCQRA